MAGLRSDGTCESSWNGPLTATVLLPSALWRRPRIIVARKVWAPASKRGYGSRAAALLMTRPNSLRASVVFSHATGKGPRPESGEARRAPGRVTPRYRRRGACKTGRQVKYQSQFYNILEKAGQTAPPRKRLSV